MTYSGQRRQVINGACVVPFIDVKPPTCFGYRLWKPMVENSYQNNEATFVTERHPDQGNFAVLGAQPAASPWTPVILSSSTKCPIAKLTYADAAPYVAFVDRVLREALRRMPFRERARDFQRLARVFADAVDLCQRIPAKRCVRDEFFHSKLEMDYRGINARFRNSIMVHLFDSEQQLLYIYHQQSDAQKSVWSGPFCLHTYRAPCQLCEMVLIAYAVAFNAQFCVTNSHPYALSRRDAGVVFTTRKVVHTGTLYELGLGPRN